MQGMTPKIIQKITGGDVQGELPEEEITAVTIDSRAVPSGALFAAIPGKRVDGHDFIADAASSAACALCSHYVPADIPQILVPDTKDALRGLATYYRGLFSIPFVGVTGSVGKTTVKEMIAAVLSARFCTLKTEKNFNNELGVPLTLFRLQDQHQAAVVEMGISDFGEMTVLTNMVQPQLVVFTLIGDAHLEFLQDRAGVLRAKGEIVEGMPPEGVVIANGDDPLLRAHDFGRRKVLFGRGEGCDIRAVSAENLGKDGISCIIQAGKRQIRAEIPTSGPHMIYAALMGAAVGLELGLTDEEICRGIAAYKTVGSRGRVIDTGYIKILDDCYNANPTSARNAVDSLCMLSGRSVAILGDMMELGEAGPRLHYELGQYAQAAGTWVIACGPLSRETARGAGKDAVWFEKMSDLIDAIPDLLQEGDTVLVKASRAMGFEQITQALTALKRTDNASYFRHV